MPEVPYLPFTLQSTAQQIHENADSHGFWPPEGRNFAEMLMLMTSELGEALEEHRDGNPVVWFRHTKDCLRYKLNITSAELDSCTCNPKPEGAAVELIDAMIRELDTLYKILEESGFTIDQVMILKMTYNNSRPHKHGKAY